MKRFFVCLVLGLSLAGLTGCGSTKAFRIEAEKQSAVIANLNNTIDELNFRLQELTRAKRELLKAKLKLESELKKELSSRKLKVKMQNEGLVITVSNKILFDPGQALIKPQAKDSLNKIARVLNNSCPNKLIRIEGHSDNRPIRYSVKYPSNWELSTARATGVLRYLIKQNVFPQRLSAVGYAEYRPIDTNDTPQGRANNRRVEIVISTKNLPHFSEIQEVEEK